MSTVILVILIISLCAILGSNIGLLFIRRYERKLENGTTPFLMSQKEELDHIKTNCIYTIYVSENTHSSCCDAILKEFIDPLKKIVEQYGTDRPDFPDLLNGGCNRIMEEMATFKLNSTYTANLLKSFINRNKVELEEISWLQHYFTENFQKDACIDYYITNYSDQCRLATNVSNECKNLMNTKTKESIASLEEQLLSLKETIENHISFITKNCDMDELHEIEMNDNSFLTIQSF